jgi:hypothetical protein
MPLAPALAPQNQQVLHYDNAMTWVDFPMYVSAREWGGAQSSAFGVSPVTTFANLGTGVSDDSAAINAALAALSGSGISLYFPQGVYLVTANAIVNSGQVPIIIGAGAQFTGTYAANLNGFSASQPFKARAVYTTNTTSTTYSGSGTNTITLGSNGAMAAQDGVTIAVGDTVIFALATLNSGTLAIASKDNGPWIVSSLGAAGSPQVFVRPTWWQTGMTIPVLQQIQLGPEGTVFHGTTWSSWAAAGTVVGTTDPAIYPDRIVVTATLSASAFTLNSIPLRSNTLTSIICAPNGGGTPIAGTIGYGVVTGGAFTAGYVPTGSATINALASGMAKNGTTDTSVISITVVNR